MTFHIRTYAQQIIDASQRLKNARDPDAAVAALDAFNALLDDHDAVCLLASTFALVADVYLDETRPQQSHHED